MEGVRAVMIVEVAGRPAEHVQSVLKDHVEKLKFVKGVSDVEINLNEPKKVEHEQGEMFSCFAEVEFTSETFLILTQVMFDFMPSSVEVLEPGRIGMDLADATSFLNNVAGRMHKYDEIAKVAQLQSQQLYKKLQMVQQELMKRDEEGKSKKKAKKSSKKKSAKKKKAKKKGKK